MAEMSKPQRTTLLVAGGALVLFLLYRYLSAQNSNAQGAATTQAAPDSAQYAALAGQEQSDIAGLQAQEQSDVANLLGANTDLGATLAQNMTDFQTNLEGIVGAGFTQQNAAIAAQNKTVAGVASGEQKLSRVVEGNRRLTSKTAVLAPFGARPPEKKGFTLRGLGSGFWEYLPVTKKKSDKKASSQGSGVRGGHSGGAAIKPKSKAKPKARRR